MSRNNQSDLIGSPKMDAKIDMYEEDFLMNDFDMENDYLSASTTDMTGLIPNGGHDDYELANYAGIYPYLPTTGQLPPEPPISEIKFLNEQRKNKKGK